MVDLNEIIYLEIDTAVGWDYCVYGCTPSAAGNYDPNAECDNGCCDNPTTTASWDCDGQNNCSDPGTGMGAYPTIGACQAACTSTAISEEGSSLLIYPNPAKNTLTIDGDYTSVTIYDLFGKAVLNY